MVSFADLPDELIGEIFLRLRQDDRKLLASVCKRFRSVYLFRMGIKFRRYVCGNNKFVNNFNQFVINQPNYAIEIRFHYADLRENASEHSATQGDIMGYIIRDRLRKGIFISAPFKEVQFNYCEVSEGTMILLKTFVPSLETMILRYCNMWRSFGPKINSFGIRFLECPFPPVAYDGSVFRLVEHFHSQTGDTIKGKMETFVDQYYKKRSLRKLLKKIVDTS